MKDYKWIIFTFNVLLHGIPLILAVRIIVTHYFTKPKKQTKHENVDQGEIYEYAQENNKVIHTLLNLMVFVVLAMIFDTFFILHKIENLAEENLSKSIEIAKQTDPNKKDVFTYGTDGIYTEVKREFEERTDFTTSMDFDIIGYTMYSVEPKLKSWFQDGYLRNMKINLIYIDPDYIETTKLIDPIWRDRVKDHIGQIKNFLEVNASKLKKDKVTITLTSFNHIPGVHGFRFRNGRCFVSFSTWDSNGKIKLPTDAEYFIIEKNETSDHGSALRKIMDNWIEMKLSEKGTNR